MTKEQLSQLAENACKSAVFFHNVSTKVRGNEVLKISAVAGYRTPPTGQNPFGVVLVAEKFNSNTEDAVDRFLASVRAKSVAYEILEGEAAKQSTSAKDNEPRVRYYLEAKKK
jgi:hypothetical protein